MGLRRGSGLLKDGDRRLRFEYVIVLRVKAASWTDAIGLSRFISDEKRMAEGRAKSEAVLRSLREAGLTLKVKQHVNSHNDKLLIVFITASPTRFEQQSHRLAIERWLHQDGVGDTAGQTDPLARYMERPGPPTMRVVNVGGSHYFAPADGSQHTEGQVSAAGAAPAQKPPPLSSAARVELIAHILRSATSAGGADLPALRKSDRRGVVLHVLPLHDDRLNQQLRRRSCWVRLSMQDFSHCTHFGHLPHLYSPQRICHRSFATAHLPHRICLTAFATPHLPHRICHTAFATPHFRPCWPHS
jgi:hypothetical protein